MSLGDRYSAAHSLEDWARGAELTNRGAVGPAAPRAGLEASGLAPPRSRRARGQEPRDFQNLGQSRFPVLRAQQARENPAAAGLQLPDERAIDHYSCVAFAHLENND